jgi:hypothetical protein
MDNAHHALQIVKHVQMLLLVLHAIVDIWLTKEHVLLLAQEVTTTLMVIVNNANQIVLSVPIQKLANYVLADTINITLIA